jgi:hypothetical protein
VSERSEPPPKRNPTSSTSEPTLGEGRSRAAVGGSIWLAGAAGIVGLVIAIAVGVGRAVVQPTDDVGRAVAFSIGKDSRMSVAPDSGVIAGAAAEVGETAEQTQAKRRSQEPAAASSAENYPSVSQQQRDARQGKSDGLSEDPLAPDVSSLSDEDLQKIYGQGFEIVIACNRSVTEYRGRPNAELESVRTEDDTEIIYAVDGLIFDRVREPAELPDTKRGEYSKCRVRFNDRGRAALTLRSAISMEGNSGLLEYGGTYELELVSGTKEDFDTGKPVAFRYSTEGLRQLRQDHRRFLERDAAELLVSGYLSSPAYEAMLPRLRAEARYVDFPNADILATSEQCVIRDSGRTLLRIAITFPK